MSPHPLTPAERAALSAELLDHLYGCAEDPAGLERRIAEEPEVAALLEEVRATRALLDAAARDEGAPTSFAAPPARGGRVRRAALRALLAAAALLLVVPWARTAWLAGRARGLEDQFLRLVVSAPSGVPDGAPTRVRVETWDLDGDPGAARVLWRALAEDGSVLREGIDDTAGACDIDLPADLAGVRRLVVRAERAGVTRETTLALAPEREAPLVHLSSDKPLYRPGERAYLRAVALDRLSLAPREGFLRVRVVDPKGAPVQAWSLPLEQGVVALAWDVPPTASGGQYALEVRDAEDAFAVERLQLEVRRFQAPRLAQTIDLDRKTYAPGERGGAELAVERVEGGVPAGAPVEAWLVVDGARVWDARGTLDARGHATFSFQVPTAVERGEARFFAVVTDGGVVETAVEPFVVPTGALTVDFYPEGGDLVADRATRVYAEVTDSLGRPADARGRVVDAEDREVARFETLHQGRALFELEPRAGGRYRLLLDEPAASAVALPDVAASGVTLRALDEDTPAGEPVRLAVATPDAGPWVAGVFCRGRLVAQDTFSGAGQQALALDVPEDVAGVLRVTVFDRALTPVAERLVHRASGRSVVVSLAPEKARLLPGEHQTLDVRTTDEQGRPVAAVVGLCVGDRAVRDLVPEPRVGLADQAFLCADVEELEDLGEFLTGDAEARRNVDLLLGTRGWRRFAWLDPDQLVAERGDEAQRFLLLEGRVDRPQVQDERGDVPAALTAARGGERRARRGAQQSSALAILLLTVCGVLLARRPWVRWTLATGLAAVLVAGLLQLRHMPGDAVALQAFDAAPRAAREARLLEALGYAGLPEEQIALGRAAGVAGPGGPGGPGGPPARGVPAAGPAVAGGGGPGAPGPGAELLAFVVDEAALEEAEVAFEPAPGDPLAKNERRFGGRFDARRQAQQVRVYAHQRAPRAADAPRVDFTETVYWNGLLATSTDGRARVEFDLADQVTTWRASADAHGAGRVGQGEATFEAVPPFHLEAKLPVELSAGDRLLLPVAVTSGDPSVAAAHVVAAVDGPLRLQQAIDEDVPLVDGRGRVLLPVEVTGVGDGAALRVAGRAAGFTDRVGRTLRVVPRGFPRRVSLGGRVVDSVELPVALPQEHVEGSLAFRLVLYPSPLADLLQGLDGILQEPSGCFEQTSATHYPNVLAAAYLQDAGVEAPAAAARARELMERGMQRLTGYECQERGYEWFGGNPGHEALTAYGLLEFTDTARVFPVDDGMVARTRAWLVGRRDGKGGFQRNDRALDSFGRAPQAITDTFCAYGLLLSGTPAGELGPEVERLVVRAVEGDDPYEVALAAAALEAAGRTEAAATARGRLRAMQREDGSLCGTTTSITSSGGNDLAVETTSLAIQAWLSDPAAEAHVRRALDWLLAQRQGSGRFGATQATVQALRALSAYARSARRVAHAGELTVLVNDFEVARVPFEAGRREPLVVPDLLEHLRPGENRVRLELSGGNEFPWAADLEYFAEQPADDPDATVGIEVALGRADATLVEGDTVPVVARLTNLTDAGQPMTLARIGLPAGLAVPTKVLDDLRAAGRFDLWERDGREVILYWRDLAPREAIEVSLDCVAELPGRTSGPASRAYLYYTPERVRWAPPLAVQVDARR